MESEYVKYKNNNVNSRQENAENYKENYSGEKDTTRFHKSSSKRRKRNLFRFRPSWLKLIIFSIIVITFVTIISTTKLFSTNAEPVVEKGTFIEQIQDMSSLATAQAYVKAVLQKEDNEIFGKQIGKNFPGTKRKVLFIIPSSVTAGIDLHEVEEEHLELNEIDKTLKITLPRATIIQEPILYLDKIETFSQEGLFRSKMNLDEGFAFAAEANEQVIEEAIDQGLLSIAEENAERTLTQFFTQLGYEVTINFNVEE